MSELVTPKLRGLVLSAVEIRQKHPDWDDAFTEDYLTIIENLIKIANEVDLKNDIIKTTTLVVFADTPYTPLATDEELFIDTDGGPIDVTLQPGIDGTNYRMINVGSSKNDVTLIPALLENLFGENASERIADSEVLVMTFETTEGWY